MLSQTTQKYIYNPFEQLRLGSKGTSAAFAPKKTCYEIFKMMKNETENNEGKTPSYRIQIFLESIGIRFSNQLI